jgi:beta-glucosidase
MSTYQLSQGATIRRSHEVTSGLPVFVTENGISTDDDAERIEYVTRALLGVERCLSDGLDVRGYFYWSLLDNFEWAFGYGPHFGLASVDRQSFQRSAKHSREWLGSVARSNALVRLSLASQVAGERRQRPEMTAIERSAPCSPASQGVIGIETD